MLERFNSFYPSTLASMVHKGWQKIPTDKVSDFFQKTVPTFTQSAWDRRPSFPTIKKIVLIPIGLFALYKTIKWIQPIFYGKGPNQPPKKDQRIPLEETDKSDDDSQDSQEGDKVESAKQHPGNGANGNQDQNFLLHQEEVDEGESSDHDSDYLSFSEEEEPILHTSENNEISPSIGEELSTLERFSSNFPGQHLECMIGEKKMPFSTYVLNTLFRIDEQPNCVIDEHGWYILTYRTPQIITVSELPPSSPNESMKAKGLRTIIYGILKFITVKIQMSQEIKVQLLKIENGTKIIFDPKSFSLAQNRWSYTAHFESLTICDQPIEDEYHLEIEVEHNSEKVQEKGGPVHHQKFVDALSFYFQQGRQLIE